MKEFLKKYITKEFLIVFVATFLVFEGAEHLLHEFFDIDLEHYLALGGIGTALLFGLKFHVLCCAIPAICTTIYCAHKNHKHCDHEHGKKQD